jgi:hypothetical protein
MVPLSTWNTRPIEDGLRAEITRLEGINESALHLLTQYGDKADEMLNLQQKLYPEYERLTAENEKLRKALEDIGQMCGYPADVCPEVVGNPDMLLDKISALSFAACAETKE